MEHHLLSSCLASRKAFETIVADDELVSKHLSPVGAEVLHSIAKYYATDPDAQHVDREILKQQVLPNYTNEKQARRLVDNIDSLNFDVSASNVLEIIRATKQATLSLELASALMATDKSKVPELLEKYQELSKPVETETTECLVGFDADSILEALAVDNRLRVIPKELNEFLGGGLPRGANVLIFARPEVGKTLFCINLTCGFLAQGYKVLYILNEDATSMILPRFGTRLSGIPKHEIPTRREEYNEIIAKRNHKNFILAPLTPGTIGEIRELVEQHKPDVLVIDQLRNLHAGKLDRVNQLDYLAQEARNIAKEFNLVCVNVTQAGDSADKKLYLDMGDVDFSNTGIPGAMDLMIGIGADENSLATGRRGLSFPKNKVSGDHSTRLCVYDVLLNKVLMGES